MLSLPRVAQVYKSSFVTTFSNRKQTNLIIYLSFTDLLVCGKAVGHYQELTKGTFCEMEAISGGDKAWIKHPGSNIGRRKYDTTFPLQNRTVPRLFDWFHRALK